MLLSIGLYQSEKGHALMSNPLGWFFSKLNLPLLEESYSQYLYL